MRPIARLVAALLLAALTFAWGCRVGETARPWEITEYGDLDAAQLSWVIESIQEQIGGLQRRLARAQAAQIDKLTARPPPVA